MICENCKQESGKGKNYSFHYGEQLSSNCDGYKTTRRYKHSGIKSAWVCKNCVKKPLTKKALYNLRGIFWVLGIAFLASFMLTFEFDILIFIVVFSGGSLLLLASSVYELSNKRQTREGQNIAIKIKRHELEFPSIGGYRNISCWNDEDYSRLYPSQ